jgi:hypothetical protein
MVVSHVEGSYYSIKGDSLYTQGGGDDAIEIFGVSRLGVFGRGIQ